MPLIALWELPCVCKYNFMSLKGFVLAFFVDLTKQMGTNDVFFDELLVTKYQKIYSVVCYV